MGVLSRVWLGGICGDGVQGVYDAGTTGSCIGVPWDCGKIMRHESIISCNSISRIECDSVHTYVTILSVLFIHVPLDPKPSH